MIDLTEAYYLVAADLKRNADELAHIAEKLAIIADRSSEARMREKQPVSEEVGQ